MISDWSIETPVSVTFSSESGQRMEPGTTVYRAKVHGSYVYLSQDEAEFMLGLRQVSQEERNSLAKKGNAMPDGSFPIASCSDAANAIHAIGRANPSKRGAVRAHIRKRVAALGCSGSTFENWK